MKTPFGKQFGELTKAILELQDLEMEVERRRLKVSRLQYELDQLVGVPRCVTVPMVRTVQ
jgi:hypothetical protein